MYTINVNGKSFTVHGRWAKIIEEMSKADKSIIIKAIRKQMSERR